MEQDVLDIHLRDHMAEQFRLIGLRAGGAALVHSSLSSLGHVPGGAATVVSALRKAIGPQATLLFPALSYEYVTCRQRVFDVLHTPSCVGAIPEYFRQMDGVMRSWHPTHSVCGIGPMAQTLLNEHHLDGTPCGARSPYRKLRDLGAQLVFIGCGTRCNTSMHGVEELTEPPYLFGPTLSYTIITEDGQELDVRSKRHNFEGCLQRYERVVNMLDADEYAQGKVLDAKVEILEAKAVWQKGAYALRLNDFAMVEPLY